MSILNIFEINGLYHIYSRGVDKQEIFRSEGDFSRFYKSVFHFNSTKNKEFGVVPRNGDGEKLAKIDCFTLMPNHFHLILKEIRDRGISKFMQKLLTSYSMYFNKKYDRTGALFENRFKSKHIDSDPYYWHLRDYIKNNPVKLINPKYKSIDLYYEKIKFSKSEKEFIKDYKFSYFAEPEVAPPKTGGATSGF